MFSVVLGVFVLLLLIGAPIAFVLAMTGITHLAFMSPDYFSVIPQRMFAGINITSLTCIPFFIIAGELMNGGGVTRKLLDFVKQIVGCIRGGLAYCTVFTAALLSAILGSSNAVASILCNTLIPDMEESGYEKSFSGGLIAASGMLGPIIPPSTTFIYYSVLTGCSVKMLFLAGIVPGVLIALAYCVVVFMYVRKHNLPRIFDKINWKSLLKSFVEAIPALLVPVVIVGGVLTGIFTPTESGAVACVIAVISGFIYKTLRVEEIPRMLLRAAKASASIMFIIACGNIMGWSMAVDGIPAMLQQFILGLTSNSYLVIALMLLILIIVGCLMEATAAMLIFSTVFLGLANAIGMDTLHFGLVFCLMLVLALVTPPVGMTLFVTANVSGISVREISKSIIPFVLAAFIVIALIAYLPDVALWMPRVFMGYGG